MALHKIFFLVLHKKKLKKNKKWLFAKYLFAKCQSIAVWTKTMVMYVVLR